jgi:hypothetical protein
VSECGQEEIYADLGKRLLGEEWAEAEKGLGIDLEGTARETKAIQRLRQIRKASDLLRLILFYALSDWSLRLVGAWASMQGIGHLSDVAILNRLRKSQEWMGKLVGIVLQRRCTALKAMPGVRLRIIDATCVSRPGSSTTNWRTHLCFDLGNLCLDGIELTDKYGGESLTRFPPVSMKSPSPMGHIHLPVAWNQYLQKAAD